MKNLARIRRALLLAAFVLIIVVLLGLLASTARDFGSEAGLIADALSTLAAIVGAGAIWHELKRGQDLSEAEFLITLNEGFSSNPDIRDVYAKIELDRAGGESSFTPADTSGIVTYVTFFETLQNLIERRMISFRMIDDIFAYRFFAMVHNRYIYENEILPDAQYHLNTFKLYAGWIAYRESIRTGLPSLQPLPPEMVNLIDEWRRR